MGPAYRVLNIRRWLRRAVGGPKAETRPGPGNASRSPQFPPFSAAFFYQVATGSLSPGDIAAPLRSVLSSQKNAQVLLGEAVDIDPDSKRVTLADGSAFEIRRVNRVLRGRKLSYYGHDEWRPWGAEPENGGGGHG